MPNHLRLVTWNINSIRLRMPLLAQLSKDLQPDIICLQETKVADPFFPRLDCQALGYPYVTFSGEKSYNGVTILSKIPFIEFETLKLGGKDDTRHIAVTLANGIELHNFYVPAGGDIADPVQNPKFAHKLNFVQDMTQWFKDNRASSKPMILVGDLNIAPLEHDVWSHKQLLDVVSHTPIEVDHLHQLYQSLTWVDVARHFVPEPAKLYSWWSYRNQDWKKSDRGRRLDHIWVTPPLVKACKAINFFKEARDWPQPSDHVPVVMDLVA
ncbi:MAG: exodeoxyribonuclease III [Alphaproteobacteria bacterium]|nr:exodeoxyribonuclease III [Alphaproteobacteria bacterium]